MWNGGKKKTGRGGPTGFRGKKMGVNHWLLENYCKGHANNGGVVIMAIKTRGWPVEWPGAAGGARYKKFYSAPGERDLYKK
jgi:hypothetical protein